MGPQPSRDARWKGAAPLSGAEEQAASAISAYAYVQGAFLLQFQVVGMNTLALGPRKHTNRGTCHGVGLSEFTTKATKL
jgi:hypothetical protein